MWNRLKALFFGLLISVVLLEIACAVFIRTSYIPARIPPYSMKDFGKLFWADIDEHVGVWHLPNQVFHHQKSCFDVSYQSNSYGAVDKERPLQDTASRVVVLGDSFVEGYGVSRETRFTDLLESQTGIAHLNFGTSGSFGSTQAFLLYEHLASSFDHNAILIGMLPDNDFDDDARFISDRYAPYWKGTYPNYELAYTLDNVDQSSFAPAHITHSQWQEVQRNFTHLRNMVDYLSAVWEYRKKVTHASEDTYVEEKSRYVRFTEEEFNRLIYSYEQIINKADNKKIIVFSIPRVYDLEYFHKNKKSPLGDKMNRWAKNKPTVHFIDLLPSMAHAIDQSGINSFDLFHTCDGHWNEQGHLLAADILYEQLDKEGVY